MSLIFDLLLLALIAVCAAGGVKRGFIRTVMGFVTLIVSLLGAWYFKASVSAWLAESYLSEKISEPIAQFIRQLLIPSLKTDDAVPRLFADMPEAFSSLLSRFGADASAAQSSIAASGDAAAALADYLARPAVTIISDAFAFILLFFSISLLMTVLIRVLDLIFKLPVLSALNRAGGLVIGLIIGMLYSWIISSVISVSIPYLSQVLPDQFTETTIDDTIIANWFTHNNPLSMFDISIIGS